MIIVTRNVISPPLRKWDRGSTRAKNSEGQDEQTRQTGAIKSTGNEVRVVLEDAGAVVAKVKLREEPGNDPAH
jgi:hypothetical protein